MSTSNSVPKVRRKIDGADIVMSAVPLILMLCLNTVFTIPAFVIGGIMTVKNGETLDPQNTMAMLDFPEAQTALSLGLIGYAIAAIIIFGIWYRKSFLKRQTPISNKEVFTGKRIALVVIGAIGVWSFINLALQGVAILFPSEMENYHNLMESSGIGTNPITTFFYVSFLGPIAEEMMFRAVSQGYLHRSGIPAAAAIFGQAIYFGIAHMNPVQSTYAVLIGAFIGLVRYKYGNVRLCFLSHIVNNVIASYGYLLFNAVHLRDTGLNIFFAVMSAAAIAAIIFIMKDDTTGVCAKPESKAAVS